MVIKCVWKDIKFIDSLGNENESYNVRLFFIY